MAGWIDELNEPQRRAVTFGEGGLLIIAGAGTGKTRTLACRVAWLIEQKVSPDRILLLTFTRRAVAEMIGRAGHYAGPSTAGQVWGGTFHSTANRLLRQYGRTVGLEPNFTVIDQTDAADMMNLIRTDLGLSQGKRRFPRSNTLAAIYSRMINSRIKLTELLEAHFPWCGDEGEGIRKVFEQYTKQKREQKILDYDDLLLYWMALGGAERIGRMIADRFEHILVDEYQDTNLLQAEILEAMRPKDGIRNITVVGDDAQSIYSFRSATVENIMEFPEKFGAETIVKLEQNYRSIQPILDASNAVMECSNQRYTKTLFSERKGAQKPAIVTCMDEDEQCGEVCQRILEKREEGVSLREQAVLFRAGYHSDKLEVELTRRNIPFVKYGGLKFLEAAHVKDMVAMLRVLENPSDAASWFRVLQLLEGVGQVTARRIIDNLLNSENGGDPIERLILHPPQVPAAARESFDDLRGTAKDCVDGADRGPAVQVERIRKFFEPIIEYKYDNSDSRLKDLEQLEQIATNYRTRGEFITDLTLDPPNSTQDLAGPPSLDDDYLILSTIHSAKGCEWDVVHIIHVADGMIPSDLATGSGDEIEEERRLLYVAMTRARNILNLYFPLRYYHRPRGLSDSHNYSQLTRFIPASASPLFERISAHAVSEQEDPEKFGPSSDATEKIDAMLGELWSE